MTRRPVALLAIAGSLALLVLATVLAALVGRNSPDQPATNPSPQNVTIPRPEQTAPADAVTPVHRALHELSRVCTPGGGTNQSFAARRPVTAILDFARRYPDVSFPLHDETGTTLSLLFVARHEVRSCAPALTERIDRLIPHDYLLPTAQKTSPMRGSGGSARLLLPRHHGVTQQGPKIDASLAGQDRGSPRGSTPAACCPRPAGQQHARTAVVSVARTLPAGSSAVRQSRSLDAVAFEP